MGTTGEWQQHFRTSCGELGAPRSEDKAVHRQLAAARLGAFMDGLAGRVGGSAERLFNILGISAHLLSKDVIALIALQILLGHWAFLIQFRREYFAFCDDLWLMLMEYGQQQAKRLIWREGSRMEIVLLMMSLPAIGMDLRRPIHPVALKWLHMQRRR